MIRVTVYLLVASVGAILGNTILTFKLGVSGSGDIRKSLWVAILYFSACMTNEICRAVWNWRRK